MTKRKPPKPPALTVVRGDPAPPPRGPLREVEFGPAVKPTWLPPDAAAIWDELAPECIENGLLFDAVTEGFAQLCVYLAAYRRDAKAMDFSMRSDMSELMQSFKVKRSALAPRR